MVASTQNFHSMDAEAATGPEEGTVERWAFDYIRTLDLEHKCRPPESPSRFEGGVVGLRLSRPGRPAALKVVMKAPRSLRERDLCHPRWRARQVHTFLHHELQAAELMCWAILAFPDTPTAFRHGLLAIALDEIRHLAMYRGHLEVLGFHYGDFNVRDWFWQRVPQVTTPAQFVAVMGIGLEGGNLDHTRRFARSFRAAGDEAAARITQIVGAEEVAHVRFAVRWFRELTGGLDFESWASHLPEPLSPLMMRGRPMATDLRRRANLPDEFLERLQAFEAARSPPAPD